MENTNYLEISELDIYKQVQGKDIKKEDYIKIKRSIVKNMLKTQFTLNNIINGDKWLTRKNKNGKWIRWELCIAMEAMELIDSLPWKHWKDVNNEDVDIENIKIELVDLMHFILSVGIESMYLAKHITLESSYEDLEEIFFQYYDLDINRLAIVIEARENTDFNCEMIEYAQYLARVNEVNLFQNALDLILQLMIVLNKKTKFSILELNNLYIAKAGLNIFRQRHGYAEGNYKKIWNGKEDNVFINEYITKHKEHIELNKLIKYLEEEYKKI